jgi:hypothetical protein
MVCTSWKRTEKMKSKRCNDIVRLKEREREREKERERVGKTDREIFYQNENKGKRM